MPIINLPTFFQSHISAKSAILRARALQRYRIIRHALPHNEFLALADQINFLSRCNIMVHGFSNRTFPMPSKTNIISKRHTAITIRITKVQYWRKKLHAIEIIIEIVLYAKKTFFFCSGWDKKFLFRCYLNALWRAVGFRTNKLTQRVIWSHKSNPI